MFAMDNIEQQQFIDYIKKPEVLNKYGYGKSCVFTCVMEMKWKLHY